MKYIIQAEIDPETGTEIEEDMEQVQGLIEKWQALKPLGMYFGLTRRAMTVIVDVPNEDAFFEALHATWVVTNAYPEVTPVADVEQFGELVGRLGLGS